MYPLINVAANKATGSHDTDRRKIASFRQFATKTLHGNKRPSPGKRGIDDNANFEEIICFVVELCFYTPEKSFAPHSFNICEI